jgi:AcrR family transcriptional regulator
MAEADHPRHLRMSELSALAGLPSTTVRYYLRLGLLPPPLRTSKTMAYYSVEHLDRLRELIRLKAQGHNVSGLAAYLPAAPSVPTMDHLGSAPTGDIHSSTRTAIVSAGITRFVDHGYDVTTIDDIVAAAGVGKAAFYRYFQRKVDLLAACLREVLDDALRNHVPARSADPVERIWDRAVSVSHIVQDVQSLLDLSRKVAVTDAGHGQDALDGALSRLLTPIEADLRDARDVGFSAATDPPVQAALLFGAAQYVSYYSDMHPGSDPAELTVTAWKVVLGVIPS